MIRGVRGATTVTGNDSAEVAERVKELLQSLAEENAILAEDIGAVIFSSTPDLNAAFPAAAARQLGWSEVPLFGTQEIDCPTGLMHCIRVLVLWNTAKPQASIKHMYLRGATVLRPDIVSGK